MTPNEKNKMTIIAFSGDLDKTIAAFNLATGAAAAGMEVTMFFTFWGLNIIKKNERPVKSKGLMRKMLNLMNKGGSKRLPLSRFHMMGLGTQMMKKLMKEAKMPSVDELIAMAKEGGVKLIACTTTMAAMDISKDDFIPEIDTFAGVATYLAEAQESKINLFI